MEDLHAKLKEQETDRVYYPHGQLAGRRVTDEDIRVYMPNGREIDPRFADHVWPVTVEAVAIEEGEAVTYINRYDNEIATGEVNEQQRPDGPWHFKDEIESRSYVWFVDGDPVAYGARYEDISAHPDVLRENVARTGIKPLPKIHSLAEAESEIAAAFAAEYAEAEKEIVSGFIAEGRMGIPSADSGISRGAPQPHSDPSPLQIGQKVYNDAGICTGIYFGTHEITAKGGLKKVFDLYAAPEDLTDENDKKLVTNYNAAAKTLNLRENWHGYDGKCFKNHKKMEKAFAKGTYQGEWFIGTKETMEMLYQNKDKGVLKGTFTDRDVFPNLHWYWSCTDESSKVHTVSFTNGSIDLASKDSGLTLSTRPVRAELRGSDVKPVAPPRQTQIAQSQSVDPDTLRIGQKIYNRAGICTGIYIGTHEITGKDGATKKFDLYAAPEGLTDREGQKLVDTYNNHVRALDRQKKWHGYDGECFENHKEWETALANDTYRGGWFMPPRQIMQMNLEQNKAITNIQPSSTHPVRAVQRGSDVKPVAPALSFPDDVWI
jgi:hypothetical protein